MKQGRPKLKLKLSKTDKVLECIVLCVVFAMWILVLFNYNTLPERIAIHYNALGKANSFGNKSYVFVLPIMATLLVSVLSVLNKSPHIFNYTKEITAENAKEQYTYATRTIRFLKLAIVIIFGFIVFKTTQSASNLGVWFLPATQVIIFGPMIYFLYLSLKKQKV